MHILQDYEILLESQHSGVVKDHHRLPLITRSGMSTRSVERYLREECEMYTSLYRNVKSRRLLMKAVLLILES